MYFRDATCYSTTPDMFTDSSTSLSVYAFTSFITVSFLPLENHTVGVRVQNYELSAWLLSVITENKTESSN